MTDTYQAQLDSPIGVLTLVASDEGLRQILWEDQADQVEGSKQPTIPQLAEPVPNVPPRPQKAKPEELSPSQTNSDDDESDLESLVHLPPSQNAQLYFMYSPKVMKRA